MGHSAMDAIHDAAHVIDGKAVKEAAVEGLHKVAHGAEAVAKVGAHLVGRATNFALSDQGQAVIKDTVHNGVALAQHAKSGNALDAINDGLSLG